MHENETKAVVSIAEMARMVGLSRSRFNQLIGSTFPWPLYSLSTRRPFYDEKLQHLCLEVRRRNCGIDGKPVLFYSRRPINTPPMRKPKQIAAVNNGKHADLIDGLKGLGLAPLLLPRWPRPSRNSTHRRCQRGPLERFCGPCSCTCGVRIREIRWGDNSHYRPSWG
jgi:hypothetical protein